MLPRKKILGLYFALLAFWIGGCQTTSDPSMAPEQTRNIFLSGALGSSLRITDVHRSFTGGDLLQVRVNLMNRSTLAKEAYYKFEWISEDGQVIPSVLSRFSRVRFNAKQPSALSGVATSREATDFRLIIQANP